MKNCSKPDCKHTGPQPLVNFTKDKKAKDGLQSQCNDCRNEAKRLARLANPEKHKASDRARWDRKRIASDKWRDNNREKYNASMREYRKVNYQKLRLLRYNLSPEQHAQMLLDQKGVCAICEQLPKGKRPLVVDHDHNTDAVRGLLCYGCNRAIAILDNPSLLTKAQAYLAKDQK
jgi:hypothetical protein